MRKHMKKYNFLNKGFSLVELLVVMAISLFVLAAASQVLIGMTTQFKQQSRIAQSGIESGFALELLRKDLAMAGYGLPVGIQEGIASTKFGERDWTAIKTTYLEMKESDEEGPFIGYQFNDGKNSNGVPPGPPRMVLAGISNDASNTTFNGSDYLVIKSISSGSEATAGEFHLLYQREVGGYPVNILSEWDAGYGDKPNEDEWDKDPLNPEIENGSWVVVLTTIDNKNIGLSLSGANYAAQINKASATLGFPDEYLPFGKRELKIVYGICTPKDPFDFCPQTGGTLRAPFNRVDYFVEAEGGSKKCARGTGVLYRAEMSHKDGTLKRKSKIIDCVADMQVVFNFAPDATVGAHVPLGGLVSEIMAYGFTAKEIRERLLEVKVYVLMHEGQFDRNYVHRESEIYVGEPGYGQSFDLSAMIGNTMINKAPLWSHYRWRVLQIAESPVGRGALIGDNGGSE